MKTFFAALLACSFFLVAFGEGKVRSIVILSDNIPLAELAIEKSAEKYGAKGAKQAQALVDEVSGLFAGGNIADEDLDVMMKALQDAYWIAKEKNKKFTPKKYRRD